MARAQNRLPQRSHGLRLKIGCETHSVNFNLCVDGADDKWLSIMLAEAMVVGFALTVAALLAGLASLISGGVAMRARLDRLLLGTFAMFLFVAWFFEPWVVHLCGWEGLQTAACQKTLTGRLWLFYAERFDPVFLNLPLWLRIVCSLDTFLFGPFYLASLYAFASGQQESAWYRTLALPASGALIYSTVVYFAYECLAEAHRASLLWVFIINLPWTLAPFLIILRVRLLPTEARHSNDVARKHA